MHKLVRTLSQCRVNGFTHLVVADNASTDGTRDFLSQLKDVDTILSEHNEGGSGGFGRIMRYFLEHTSFDYLLLMDDDAYPTFTHASLSDYLVTKSTSGVMAFAFRVTYPNGSLCEMNRPGKNVLLQHPLHHIGKDHHINESTGETAVDWASFVGLLLTREAIQRVGVVSTQFFIYSDDVYYTLSISRIGGNILYCPYFTFIHDCNRSSRNLLHHDPKRLEKDVVNKIVLIREFSAHRGQYIFLYLLRLIFTNPAKLTQILSAANKGLRAHLDSYRNQPS